MRTLLCAGLLLLFSSANAQHSGQQKGTKKDSLKDYPGTALFAEVGGKGYGSVNIGFKLKDGHRVSLGILVTPYTIWDESMGEGVEKALPSLGFMYYFIKGRNNSFFEIGAGMSSTLRFDLEYRHRDPHGNEYKTGMFNAHAVIGYRYQKASGLLFRAGFTPLFQIVEYILPIFGVSFGYSF